MMYEGFFDLRSTRIPLTHCIVTYSLYLIVGLGLVQRSVPRLSRQRRNTWLCQYQGHAESRWHAKAGNAAFLLKSYKSSTHNFVKWPVRGLCQCRQHLAAEAYGRQRFLPGAPRARGVVRAIF
jgi:hypothetical protein